MFKETDQILDQKLENIFSDSSAQENTETEAEASHEKSEENDDHDNNNKLDSNNSDDNNDVKQNIIEKESEDQEIDNLDKQLSGFTKEMIETVKSIKNPEDREKTIKIAREQRAREDRLSLQLGNTKKELNNISGLLQHLQTKPAETFKALAKEINFNLKDAVEDSTVQDELYLTPEELIDRKTIEIQHNTHKYITDETNKREIAEVLTDFFSDKNYDEEFLYNNKASFNSLFDQEIYREIDKRDLNPKDYIPRKIRLDAMKAAYHKLERLQPDYENKIEARIRQKIDKEKKEKFDEAKKQLKFSKPFSNSNQPETFDHTLSKIWG